MKNGKKGIIALAALASLAFFASCNGKKYDVEGAAKRVMVNEDKSEAVTADFTVPRTVTLDGNTFNVDWSSNNEYAKVSSSTEDAKYLIDIDYINNRTQAQDVTLTATVSIEGYKQTVTKTFGFKIPKFVLNTIAEADAANSKTNLTLKGVIVAKEAYSSSNKGTNVYLKCDGGGFEAYKLTCTEDQYKKELEVGNTIYVSGPKSYYNGLRELSGCSYIYDDKTAKQTLTATDLTDKLGSITKDYQCNLVKFTNVEIVSIDAPDKDGQYSIVVGDPNDATKQDVVRVSKYFFTGKTAEDYAFKDLNLVPGQKITATGFLGWYNKAQLTLTKAEDLVAGEVNYASGLASAYKTAAAKLFGKQSVPNRVIDLPSRLADLGITDENYAGFTVEWKTTSTDATITSKEIAEQKATDKKPYEAAYTKYTITTNKPAEDTNVTITCDVKNSAGEVVATRNVTFKLIKEVNYNTFEEYTKAETGAEVFVKGTIASIKTKDNTTLFLQDDNGNVYYLYNKNRLSGDWLEVGNVIGVVGTMSPYNGMLELADVEYLEPIGTDKKTVTVVDYTETFTTNGFESLETKDQCKVVKFNGVVKSSESGTFVITVGEKDINVYAGNAKTLPTFETGDKVIVTGLLGVKVTTKDDVTTTLYQVLLINTEDMVDNNSDAEKVASAAKKVLAQFPADTLYEEDTVITLVKKYGDNQTIAVDTTGLTTVKYDSTTGKLTIEPSSTEIEETFKFTVTIGEATSEEKTVKVKSKLNPNVKKPTLVFPTAQTALVTGTVISTEDKTYDVTTLLFGADVSGLTAKFYYKNSSNSNLTTDMLKLYQNDIIELIAADGWKISKIEATTQGKGTGSNAIGKLKVTKGETEVSDSDSSTEDEFGTFEIDATSCTLLATAQVRFKALKVTLVKTA